MDYNSLFSLGVNILIVLATTALSNAIGTLKTIFSIKKVLKPLYITTFIDAMMFAFVMKKVTAGDSSILIVVFALGKVLGAWLGDYLDERFAFGIVEADVLINDKEKMTLIADELRNLGYTTETFVSYGLKGKKRYRITVTIKRKELSVLKNILNQYEYGEPTLKTRDVNSVEGKYSITSTTDVA